MYRGSLMSNGQPFDTNMDTSFGHTEPFSFVPGRGEAIKAWEEAFVYFGKGGSGRIFVPALSAYGPMGNGPKIPPYSNLIFDVQITDIGVAPKKQEQPMMDPRMLEQMQQQQQQQQQQRPPGQ